MHIILQVILTIIGAFLSVVLTKFLIQNGRLLRELTSYTKEGFKSMKEGFKRMEEGFKRMDEGFKRMDEGFKKMDEEFKKILEKMSVGFQLIALLIVEEDPEKKKEIINKLKENIQK